jgi:COMPASS component SWD1
MKAEEENVDIESIDSPTLPLPTQRLSHGVNGGSDEDMMWADEEADEDVVGWKMKLRMEDDTEHL